MSVESLVVDSKAPSSAATRPATAARPDAILNAQQTIERELAGRLPRSVELHARALAALPGGVTHDNRRVAGPSLFVREAAGAWKTDVDGHRYVDYWVGHGSLLLGHSHPAIVAAVQESAGRITHPGACHEQEVQWAERVRELVPSAERVRFTASGSESSALAVRLARAWTGRKVIIKFEGHFHGWLDHAVEAVDLPFEAPWSAGVPEEVRGLTLVLPGGSLEKVEAVLASRKDIAGIILEPTGASGGTIPVRPEFLKGLRVLTQRYGVALIFDEVITGFRVAPGGAQARFGVLPDLTCLAKVLAGGLPGGAVCGTREAFKAMEFTGDAKADRLKRVGQYGTFNANPLSAAAGVAMLDHIRDGAACQQAERYAQDFRTALNALFKRLNVPWGAYGFSSVFHILTADAKAGVEIRDSQTDAADLPATLLKKKGPLDGILRRALLLEGVDLPPGRQAWVSTAHGNAELTVTLSAFERAIQRLRSSGCLD